MSLGKHIRLNRIFAHPSGRICTVAVDHFPIYDLGLPPGLRRMKQTLAQIVEGQPDAVTMHKGMANSLWGDYAGRVPLIIQSSLARPDDSGLEHDATVEDAARLGADAIAVVVYVRGKTEAYYLRVLADLVRESERYQIPVIVHTYPRDVQAGMKIVFHPEDIAWAVRCCAEIGPDVIKVPYCGDVLAHTQIVADCPYPVVAAGGPQTPTFEAALQLMADACAAGVRGATIGRNIWGTETITQNLRAFKAVIHDGQSPAEAVATHLGQPLSV
jgi:class I fructose-bisphosphate aldolase